MVCDDSNMNTVFMLLTFLHHTILMHASAFQKSSSSLTKDKLRFSNTENAKIDDVSHKNVVIKNLVTKMTSTESLNDDELESDGSNDSTMSDGGLVSRAKKRSPKFVSEPNLSVLDSRLDDETPKNTKKQGSRLFRSKILSTSQNVNKKYQKRGGPVRNTPTCVSCFDEQDTGSENEHSCLNNEIDKNNLDNTPRKSKAFNEEVRINCLDKTSVHIGKINYLTSTPGMSEADIFDEEICTTPYSSNFRRASMSPITKSTQKLSKAMQVC